MPIVVNAEEQEKQGVSSIFDLLNSWEKTFVVGDYASPHFQHAAFLLWWGGYPIVKVTSGDIELNDESVHPPPPIKVPILLNVSPAFSQWEGFIKERCLFVGQNPEEVPIENTMEIRLSVVSASCWRDEMEYWEVLHIVLVDTPNEGTIPTPRHAIYVVPCGAEGLLLEIQPSDFSCHKVFSHPPHLVSFSSIRGGFVAWEDRLSVGAILDPRFNSQGDIKEFRSILTWFDIPETTYEDAPNFKAILLPLSSAFFPTSFPKEVLDVAARGVLIFTNSIPLTTFYPMIYSCSTTGSPLGVCLQAHLHHTFCGGVDSEGLLSLWLSFLHKACLEFFILDVLSDAYNIAYSMWGAGMLPPPIVGWR